MDKESIHTKTKEECWTEFWDIIGPAIVDLHRQGKWPTREPEPAAA